MHLILKRWLGRKWPAQVLVGLQALGCGHLVLGLTCPRREPGPRPHMRTPNAWEHLTLELPCMCAGSDPHSHVALGLACPMPKANGSRVRTQGYWVLGF